MAHRLSGRHAAAAHFRSHSGKDGKPSRMPGGTGTRRGMPCRRGAGHGWHARAGKLCSLLLRARPCTLSCGQKSGSAFPRHAENAVRLRPTQKRPRRTFPRPVDTGGNRTPFQHDAGEGRRGSPRGAFRVLPSRSQGTAHRRRAERPSELLLSLRPRPSSSALKNRISRRVCPLSGRRPKERRTLRRARSRRGKPSCPGKGPLSRASALGTLAPCLRRSRRFCTENSQP